MASMAASANWMLAVMQGGSTTLCRARAGGVEVSRDAVRADAADGSSIHAECDNGVGYIFDFVGLTVSMYDPANPDGGTTQGPLPLAQRGGIGWDWVDPVDGVNCDYVSTSHVATVVCTGGGSSTPPAQASPASNAPAAHAISPADALAASAGPPATLTDDVRADILAAVDRANTAWTAAGQSLDTSALDGVVAGQELNDDIAEIDQLRSQGRTRNNVQTAFTVTGVTLDAPGHATVHTHETLVRGNE
jgi:hypothetical protein